MSVVASSPMMRPEAFDGPGAFGRGEARPGVMTVNGAIAKAAVLLALCVATAVGSWVLVSGAHELMLPFLFGGLIVGAVTSLVMIFKPAVSPFLAPVYALSEGVFIGAVSLVYATASVGTKVGGATGANIVASAAIGTFAILGVMLGLYKVGLVRVTGTFLRVMYVCGAAIGVYLLVMLGMALFGVTPGVLLDGPLAIVICAAILLYASFCLVLDFNFIEEGAAQGA
ncbi:MAG: Bax inhibitor-1/YccA family protein, partial [Phycisphaerales bacterium]|nr:Bax inhibitor-1/YccA family protein [Phycisphaerales bacterium]